MTGVTIGETALLLHRCVRSWLLLYTGLPADHILPAVHKDQQRPDEDPFISIRVRRKQGRVTVCDQRIFNADGTITIRGERRAMVQLTGYGASAVEALDDLEYSRALPSVEELLFASGIVVEDITEALEENAQHEAQWEPRTFRELRLGFIEVRTVAAGDHATVLATDIEAPTTIADFDDDTDLGIVADISVTT